MAASILSFSIKKMFSLETTLKENRKKKDEAHERANCSKSVDKSELGTYVVSLDVIRPGDNEFN